MPLGRNMDISVWNVTDTPTELPVRGNIFQNDEIEMYLQGEAEIPHVEKVFQLAAEGYINPGEKTEKDANFSTD